MTPDQASPQSAGEHGSAFFCSLVIANRISEMAKVEAWLVQLAERLQLTERTVFRLDMVLNEALPNIFSYAYGDSLVHEIRISLEKRRDDILLEIVDDGLEFNPFARPPLPTQQSLESASITGRGIHLIKSFTDEQDYQRLNHANIMRVLLRGSAAPTQQPNPASPDG